ncbi:MAG: sigma-54 dependent transcriptional regulator [Deltaproteobacteria bacterium]|nr:sigma-54 dependent transcriptional regulator [Deltaproteobacteria bacterium]
MANILIIDDEKAICTSMARAIEREGHDADYALTLEEGLKKITDGRLDVVFLDVRFPEGNGLKALPKIRGTKAAPEVIIITAEGDSDGAELAIKSGAWDYIEKPASMGSLLLPLKRALQYRAEKWMNASAVVLKREGILGNSRKIMDCLDIVAQAAAGDANTLITGETGTGKELFARAIHDNSARINGNFVVVDCASLPQALVESVLFGHRKGAFTGAEKAREGLIKQADGGTLFLDEVGELSLDTQRAFLRVLQERSFRPVAGKEEVKSDFRLIAATNRNLDERVNKGRFRKDLLYRLRSISLELPPLRERREDTPQLALFHTAKLSEKYGTGIKGLSPEFLESLFTYEWPGNVRELMSALENALGEAGDEPTLFPKHLPDRIRIKLTSGSLKGKGVPGEEAGSRQPESLPRFRDFLQGHERRYFTDLMSLTRGNIQKACEVSGLSRSSLYEHLKKLNLK